MAEIKSNLMTNDYAALCAKHGITLTHFHAIKVGPNAILKHRFQADGHPVDVPFAETPAEVLCRVQAMLAEHDRRTK